MTRPTDSLPVTAREEVTAVRSTPAVADGGAGRVVESPTPTRPVSAVVLEMVVLRIEDPTGTCQAWVDSRDALCGKPADDIVCATHLRVAVTRHAKRRDKDRAIAARRAAEAEALRPKRQADLARIEARLNAIDPFRRDDRGDGAVVNMPLAKRMPSDARISKLAHLHAERDRLRSLLGVRPA